MSVFELPTVTLIPNGIHHPPIEDGRLLPNSVKTVVDMLKQGIPVAEIAKENGISRPTIYKIKKANDL
ncbi:hypothetical protein DPX30_16205 [Enterococcus faecium]|nr:hypothetical protein DPX30_16205 [Enterococcus faecium]